MTAKPGVADILIGSQAAAYKGIITNNDVDGIEISLNGDITDDNKRKAIATATVKRLEKFNARNLATNYAPLQAPMLEMMAALWRESIGTLTDKEKAKVQAIDLDWRSRALVEIIDMREKGASLMDASNMARDKKDSLVLYLTAGYWYELSGVLNPRDIIDVDKKYPGWRTNVEKGLGIA